MKVEGRRSKEEEEEGEEEEERRTVDQNLLDIIIH
jgi:hypothetical protein